MQQIADERALYERAPNEELKAVRLALRTHSWANTPQEKARLIAVEGLLKERSRKSRRKR